MRLVIEHKCRYCDNICEVKRITPRTIVYRSVCSQHRGVKKYKTEKCEICGFVAEHRCQLDIHHRDGNSKNSEEFNLCTICANCHRLITYRQKHYQRKGGHNASS